LKGIVMRDIGCGKRRLLAGVLGVVLAVGFGAQGALAQSADEEDLPLETKIFRRFMKDLGMQRDGDQIEYRERAPLVVPPSRNLPPPQAGTVSSNNPAWPKDPELLQQKREAAVGTRRKTTSAAEAELEDARVLRPNELYAGRTAPGTPTATPKTPEESARALRPSELGSKGLFSGLFSTFGGSDTAQFTGEPPRENLTAPPAGYQTPSPNQPYGITASKKGQRVKPATLESRAVGN
jgi:hypothetical protein